ncbi:MAG: hypothetical protein HUJ58_04080 [Erysipelotrichaceae bacterium]|nr:hypothetical protein [Erysipelotrichaceae bacterium]
MKSKFSFTMFLFGFIGYSLSMDIASTILKKLAGIQDVFQLVSEEKWKLMIPFLLGIYAISLIIGYLLQNIFELYDIDQKNSTIGWLVWYPLITFMFLLIFAYGAPELSLEIPLLVRNPVHLLFTYVSSLTTSILLTFTMELVAASGYITGFTLSHRHGFSRSNSNLCAIALVFAAILVIILYTVPLTKLV